MPDQFNVSGGIALFAGQAVGIERSADLGASFRRYPLDQPGVADIFKKHGRNLSGPDLGDNPGDIAGAWFGLGGNAQRRYEVDAVGGGE